jgi:Fic family protein
MHRGLNTRQQHLHAYVLTHDLVSTRQALAYLQSIFPGLSRATVSRDLEVLLKGGFIIRQGQGRSVVYQGVQAGLELTAITRKEYFKVPSEQRNIKRSFNFTVFSTVGNILTETEKERCQILSNLYQAKRAALPVDIMRREVERMAIDFSWKSSQIEGNTYSLLETEALLKNKREAIGHNHEEAVMILNHKKTLDYIQQNEGHFQELLVVKIEEIHTLLTEDLDISKGLRQHLVRISGTEYLPLDNIFQIKEALEQTCELINKTENVFEKTILALLLIAYIQPFSDGNKRTSRLVGNALLEAFGACPLSYRSMDELEYKKAVLLFYEQNSTTYFKDLFLEQLEFAVENYF